MHFSHGLACLSLGFWIFRSLQGRRLASLPVAVPSELHPKRVQTKEEEEEEKTNGSAPQALELSFVKNVIYPKCRKMSFVQQPKDTKCPSRFYSSKYPGIYFIFLNLFLKFF